MEVAIDSALWNEHETFYLYENWLSKIIKLPRDGAIPPFWFSFIRFKFSISSVSHDHLAGTVLFLVSS